MEDHEYLKVQKKYWRCSKKPPLKFKMQNIINFSVRVQKLKHESSKIKKYLFRIFNTLNQNIKPIAYSNKESIF